MNIEEKIDELVNKIYETSEYRELKRTKRILLSHKSLACEVRKIQLLQKKVVEEIEKGHELQEEVNKLSENYEQLCKNKMVLNYIKALKNLNKKINYIDDSINIKIEKDIMI